MHTININMKNFKVTNYDSDTRPFEFKINVNDIHNLTKETEIETKYQKIL